MKYSFEDAMKDPSDIFARPRDVLESAFSREDKRKILKSWEDLIELRQTATQEGMASDTCAEASAAVLQEVANTLEQLED